MKFPLKLLNTCIYTVKDKANKITIYLGKDGQKLKKVNSPKTTGFILLWDTSRQEESKNLAFNWCDFYIYAKNPDVGSDRQKLQLPLVQNLTVLFPIHWAQPLLHSPQRGKKKLEKKKEQSTTFESLNMFKN